MTLSEIIKFTTNEITQFQQSQKNKTIAAALAKLNIAYPVQTRSFSEEDVRLLSLVWHEAFEDTEADILEEAVKRFIKNDRKGFFPAPGQIMEYVEEIGEEIESKLQEFSREEYVDENSIRIRHVRFGHKKSYKAMVYRDSLLKNGKDYSTCKHAKYDASRNKHRCSCPLKDEEQAFCYEIANIICGSYEPG
jgi:hypothetical protein